MTTRCFTRDGREIFVITEADLSDPLVTDQELRAYCHLHGSDHQRSLSINRETGWGYCHACQAKVLLTEYNPDAAANLLREAVPHLHQPSGSWTTVRETRPLTQSVQTGAAGEAHHTSQWQQKEREQLLTLSGHMMQALHHVKALAYLSERAIPFAVASSTQVGYFPEEWLADRGARPSTTWVSRWADRLIFPLDGPAGPGFIGRTLWRWQPGMDEQAHQQLLEEAGARAPKRWLKTNPAGWFGPPPTSLSETLIVVEGAFDRLALLSCGVPARSVIALVGTAAQPGWFPRAVRALILALDGDPAGQEAQARLAKQFERAGLAVESCPPTSDAWGKDWSERVRRLGPQAAWPLFEALSHSHRSAHPSSPYKTERSIYEPRTDS